MKKIIWVLLITLLLLTACASPSTGPRTLTVMTHDSFAVSEDIVRNFEAANNVTVVFLKSGDAGSMLNKAILSKEAPLADVLFGVDNTFLSRALAEGIFEPYASPALATIPSEFKLDASNHALPVDYGDVCINYDVRWFAEKGLAVPQSFDDLLQPEYKGLLVVENPATSSPGLAFLLATVSHYGPEGFIDFWAALRANDVKVADGWETAYYSDFSASSGRGPRPMVVSYASSPAAEVIFGDPRPARAPTASIVAPGMCFRQVEFSGILKDTTNRELAEKWLDFMLSAEFQNDMPLQMFVFPILPGVDLPQEFVDFAPPVLSPAILNSAAIAANREAWVEAWAQAVLR